ncbi:MAG: urease accessory protein UreE [Lachnospiraceae bacterium]
MLCEKILGKIKDQQFEGLKVDYVDIEWHEAFKKLHRKVSSLGKEVGIRLENDILKRGLEQDDVLGVEDDTVVAVNIPACEVIVIKVDNQHPHMREKVCYEIGNKHATMFWGDQEGEFITPYNEPTLVLMQKLHGVTAFKETRKLDFSKSIGSSINNHTH